VTNDEGRAGRSTAWGVAAGIFAATAVAFWQVAIPPKSTFPILPAYACAGLTLAALYMCFATVWGWWPTGRAAAISPPGAAELTGADDEDAALAEAASPTGPAASDSSRVATDQLDDVNEANEPPTPATADVFSERFRAEWEADISLFTALKYQPSFQEASAALRRGAELNLISKHGIRAPLGDTSLYLRIPHPDYWPSKGSIPLHLELRWLEGVFAHEWTSDQSFVDTFLLIATGLHSSMHWEGEQSYNPTATFEQFASLLLYGVEMIRKGSNGVINRIFQIVEDDWIITEWELIDKAHHYQILFRRFNNATWMEHVTEKVWVNRSNFQESFGTSQMLIYTRIFEGALPPDWVPPNIWPFKITLADGTVVL
jgi:hypothetical protein